MTALQTQAAPRMCRPAPAVLTAAVLVLGLLAPATPAHAAAIAVAAGLVDAGADDACSLREAIANAEADAQVHADCPAGAGADVITLPGGTYELDFPVRDGGDGDSAFTITTDLTVVGAGAVARAGSTPTVLDADGTRRHFRVTPEGALALADLRLVGGVAETGGAVLNGGQLVVTDAILSANAAMQGSAVANAATATITTTSVTGNAGTHPDGGSAVLNDGHAVLHLRDSSVHGNTVTGVANLSTLAVSGSTISANTGALAGGILNATVGGCVFNACVTFSGDLVVRNSTISGNAAGAPSGAGGIYSTAASDAGDGGGVGLADVELVNATVARNGQSGAQVRAAGAVVRNTVIAQPAGGVNCEQTDDVAYHGRMWTGDHNLTDGSCAAAGFAHVTDAGLQPLASNGGPTPTHQLHPASPAIDAGNAEHCGGRGVATTDQRGEGYPRTVGPSCDIGGVEGDLLGLTGVLRADVEALRFEGPGRHEGLRTSLTSKLDAAAAAIERGDEEAAAGQLQGFGWQVGAHSGGAIMEADADRLITGATAITGLLQHDGEVTR